MCVEYYIGIIFLHVKGEKHGDLCEYTRLFRIMLPTPPQNIIDVWLFLKGILILKNMSKMYRAN